MDPKIVEQLVKDRYDEIYRFCYARMRNKSSVDDVVQDVFLTLQEQQAQLEPQNLRAWLYSVAHKKIQEQKREEIRLSRSRQYLPELAANDPALLYEIADEAVSDAEIDRVRQKILQSLSPAEQRLFESIYVQHVKRRELAAQLGITENALNVRAYRLRQHIRQLMETTLIIILTIFAKRR